MTILKNHSFTVNSDLQLLDQVLEQFDQLYQPWILKKDWLQCQLALVEGFTNAVRHAHDHLPTETPIEIQLVLKTDGLEIRIWDQGDTFDLNGYLEQLMSEANAPQLAGHGQGLPILRKISTYLSYTRTEDNRNCLLIIKQFSNSQSL